VYREIYYTNHPVVLHGFREKLPLGEDQSSSRADLFHRMKCFSQLTKILPILALAPSLFAAYPVLNLTVGGGASDVTITPGTTLSVTGRATDADGDMSEHWLEIKNPSGIWSWEGWLTGEPWAGALVGDARSSTKTTNYTFDAAGVYQLRTTAIDSGNVWIISNVVYVTVKAADATPPVIQGSTAQPPSSIAVGTFTDAGFETLSVGVNDFYAFRYHPVVANWTFTGEAGISGNGSGFTSGNAAAPGGTQVAFIQRSGSLSQVVQLAAGTYKISAQVAQRTNWQVQSQKVNVFVGSQQVGTFAPSTTSYAAASTDVFTVGDGQQTINFAGTAALDGTLFLDQLSIVAAPAPVTPPPPPPVPPAVTGTIFDLNGNIDPAAYSAYNKAWDQASKSARLGPTFAQLNPGVPDTRPTLFKPTSRSCSLSYANKIDPYELGPTGGCYADGDYWSESGQVAYVADDASNPGLDRVQVYAYYDNVFALSPRLDYASGEVRPDAQTKESTYYTQLGGQYPMQPVASVRNYGMLSNEALVVYKNGLLGVAGTQTSRGWWERPYPGIVFPANKVPTGLAVTTGNEFALVTVWDTATRRGQLAVVALEGKYIPFHTWPYMAMQNQGSWSDMKLLGYVDLPIAAPSSVAAASNGFWNGPSQTNNQVLSQIDLSVDSVRNGLRDGDAQWSSIVANKGYAIVASKLENKAVLVDLAPLFAYVRDSYLGSAASFQQTVANRGSGAGQWPATFAERSDILPRVVWSSSVTTPTAVLAGLRLDRWSPDRFKAYVACEDGTIHILDTSSLMARQSWEKNFPVSELGTTKVGRNPVSMAFTRFVDYPLPLLPVQGGTASSPDPLNNTFYVACRGDRRIDTVVTYEGKGAVYRTISDSRMGDPVGVSVAGRGNIVSVTDYAGKKLLSFRIGGIWDRNGRYYGPGADGKADFEFGGELSFPGTPFLINSANVN
jgi:hypothetical protein